MIPLHEKPSDVMFWQLSKRPALRLATRPLLKEVNQAIDLV
jgi:hypothetical protein